MRLDQDIEAEKKNEDEEEEVEEGAKDFNYILNMPLWSLSKERKEALLKQVHSHCICNISRCIYSVISLILAILIFFHQRDDKIAELEALKLKTPKDLWRTDLDAFLEELDVSSVRRIEILARSCIFILSLHGIFCVKFPIKHEIMC